VGVFGRVRDGIVGNEGTRTEKGLSLLYVCYYISFMHAELERVKQLLV
jgi:hypothetical protein